MYALFEFREPDPSYYGITPLQKDTRFRRARLIEAVDALLRDYVNVTCVR